MNPLVALRALAFAAVAACAAAAPTAPASAQQSTEEPAPDLGAALTSEELRAAHSGRDMTGCYFNRPEEPVWRERMAADGRLYDLLKGGAEVGRWWVEEGGVICFRYTDRIPGPHCFTGRRRGGWFDFYSAFGGEIVATTQCRDEPIA